MNSNDYFSFVEALDKRCLDLSKKKNADYTGGSESAFSNFEGVETGGVTTEQGFYTRLYDKWSRFSTFVKKGTYQVEDEKVEDTVMDMINYLKLYLGYRESQRRLRESETLLPKPAVSGQWQAILGDSPGNQIKSVDTKSQV